MRFSLSVPKFSLSALGLRHQSRVQPWHQATVALISSALHEPEHYARNILQRSTELNLDLQADYLRVAKNERLLSRRIERINNAECDTLNLWFKEEGAKILAGAHTEHYLIGLLALMRQIDSLGHLLILRRRTGSQAEQQMIELLEKRCQSLSVLTFTLAGLARAMRHLRHGGHLMMMLDIPLHFGTTKALPADCLGQRLAFPIAIAKMAMSTSATIIPVTLIRQNGEEHVSPREPFRVVRGDSDAATLMAVTQRLAQNLDFWVRASPESWLLWSQLPQWLLLSEDLLRSEPRIV